MIVVKIGGCNGSGKTSLVRAMITDNNLKPVGSKKIEAYEGKLEDVPLTILGSYINVCGGMDTISDKEDRLALILKYISGKGYASGSRPGIVVFEGLITGKTYGKIGEISDLPMQKGKWVYSFMDTPFDVCVRRVLDRRAERGNTNEFDPERTMRPTFKACESVARKAAANGHHVASVDHRLAPSAAAKELLSFARSLS